MNVQAISLLLLGVALTAMGCKDDGCAMEGDITAGCGLMVDGEPLRLGDTLDLLTEEHGAPTLLDLGASGTDRKSVV